MSSVQHLREFISERLTAAAEEIFTEFEKTIVQYEEEIDRQRRLLDITWKPQRNLHTADVQQQHDCQGEVVLADQQLFKQDMSSSLDQEEPEPPQIKEDQEEPEPPQIKEDQEEVHISQEGEQLVLKDETDMVVQCKSESEELFTEFQNTSIQYEEETDHQPRLLNIIMMPQIKLHRTERHVQDLKEKSPVRKHHAGSTGEKPFSCNECGKCFRYRSAFNGHMRTHTGEKPYACNVCGKCFKENSKLTIHMRTHTGEKPYSCEICRKAFKENSALTVHMRTHTGEKPYACNVCGKCYIQRAKFTAHMRTHTGEKL